MMKFNMIVKTRPYPFFILMFFCLAVFPLNADPAPLKMHVDTTKAFEYKKTAFGVNCAIWHPSMQHNHPDFIRKYLELGSRFIRFPGGTLANHYSREKNVNTSRLTAPFHWNTDTFIEFVNATQTEFTFVMNLFTMTPEENAEWLEYMKAKGLRVNFIEIGNEIYLRRYRKVYPDAESYIKAAKEYVKAAKKVYPNAKTGMTITAAGYNRDVVYSAEESQGGMKINHEKESAWDLAIAKEDFYDAVIVHLYTPPHLEWKPDNRQVYITALAHADRNFEKAKVYHERTFPGKELWVTEWNIGGWNKPAFELGYRDTHGGALYAADFQMKLLLSDLMDKGSFHNFPTMLKFSKPWKNYEKPYPKEKVFGKSAAFEALALYREPIANTDQLMPVAVSGAGTFRGPKSLANVECSDITAGCFLGKDRTYLILINRMGTPYTIDELVFDKAKRTGGGVLRSVFASDVETKLIGKKGKGTHIEEGKFDDLSKVVIRPYSANLISLDTIR